MSKNSKGIKLGSDVFLPETDEVMAKLNEASLFDFTSGFREEISIQDALTQARANYCEAKDAREAANKMHKLAIADRQKFFDSAKAFADDPKRQWRVEIVLERYKVKWVSLRDHEDAIKRDLDIALEDEGIAYKAYEAALKNFNEKVLPFVKA